MTRDRTPMFYSQVSLSELSQPEYSELEEAIASVFGITSFAAKKTAGGQPKTRNCNPAKSIPCGSACVRKTSKSGKPTQCKPKGGLKDNPDAKQASDWLAQNGSALTVTKKEDQSKSTKSGQDLIDEKYSSSDPSDADVENWLKESIVEQTKPDRARAEQDVIKDYAKEAGILKGADSADDLAKKIYAQEQDHFKKYKGGKKYEAKDFYLGPSDADIEKARRQSETGKTEESRKKAKAKHEKLLKQREEQMKSSQEAADRLNKRVDTASMSKKARIAEIKNQINERTTKKMESDRKLHEDVKAGKKKAIAEAEIATVRRLKAYTPGAASSYGGRGDILDVVKTHLKDSVDDASVLGLKGKPTRDELKSAYRKAAQQAHPDRGGSEAAFRKVNAAYEKLKERYNFSEDE